MTITVMVNGKEEYLEEDTSLLDLLAKKNLDPEAVVVEHNLNIIQKEALKEIILNDNDRLEVLRFVGGG